MDYPLDYTSSDDSWSLPKKDNIHFSDEYYEYDSSGDYSEESSNSEGSTSTGSELPASAAQHKRKKPSSSKAKQVKPLTKAHKKKYKCPICFKLYPSKSYLKQHIGFHNNVKPFKCRECGSQFTTRSNCKQHRKRVHKKDASAKKQATSGSKKPLNEEKSQSTVLHLPLVLPLKHVKDSLSHTALDQTLNETPPKTYEEDTCLYCNLRFAHQEDFLFHKKNIHTS